MAGAFDDDAGAEPDATAPPDVVRCVRDELAGFAADVDVVTSPLPALLGDAPTVVVALVAAGAAVVVAAAAEPPTALAGAVAAAALAAFAFALALAFRFFRASWESSEDDDDDVVVVDDEDDESSVSDDEPCERKSVDDDEGTAGLSGALAAAAADDVAALPANAANKCSSCVICRARTTSIRTQTQRSNAAPAASVDTLISANASELRASKRATRKTTKKKPADRRTCEPTPANRTIEQNEREQTHVRASERASERTSDTCACCSATNCVRCSSCIFFKIFLKSFEVDMCSGVCVCVS